MRIAYPYASNLDEFDPLIYEAGVSVVPIRDVTELSGFHAVILPGSKNTVESLRFLRQTGLAAALTRAAGGVAVWTTHNLTIRGIGGRAHLRADGQNA